MLETLNGYLTLDYVPLGDVAIRLCLAAAFGAVIGIERSWKHKPLGMRPFVLIATGACLAVLATMEIAYTGSRDELLTIDPAKVIGGILGGIGFLGGAALFRNDNNTVRGAATAASIWMTGGVGVACGAGFVVPAVIAVLIGLLTLFLGPVRDKFDRDSDPS
ncbi:MgtC/SapB family protein [Hyphobacterium marinum]|uniref:Protein MgtC n=1 Tax=Hyphobacterium marinum TaxID=3116574 RepID=A0ABU7M1U7_9PROT|nr:MgtC/SapB family protein [Hyphobacterium sp. Y6023]MEE2567776.1 MgtC/SapB family protein [Hyphobacterium sp. Y6023]